MSTIAVMAAATLYLTAAERSLYDKLPEAVREGWVVETQGIMAPETPRELMIRFHMTTLRDPQLKRFAEKAQSAQSPKEIEAIAQSVDFTSLSPEMWGELFFVMGTGAVSVFLSYLLMNAKADEDLDAVATLTLARRLLQESRVSR